MGDLTKKGLLILIVAVIIQISAAFCLFFVANSLPDIFALIMAVMISIISGLLALIGLIVMVVGRKEFGENHSKLAMGALIIYILSVVISFFFSMINSMIQIMSNNSTNLTFSSFQTSIAAVLGGLMYIFLLYELEDKKGKIVLAAAFIATIITSLYIAIQSIPFYENLSASYTMQTMTITEIFSSLSGVYKAGIYTVIGSVLLLIALIIPYQRITSGELAPVVSRYDSSYEFRGVHGERRCPNCGRIVPFDARICPYCEKQFESILK